MKSYRSLLVTAMLGIAACSAERIMAGANPKPAGLDRVSLGSGNVLYILDGQVLEHAATDSTAMPDAVRTLKAGDIARIQVIKGRAAREKYGAAGENGVVLIYTKHGS